MALPAQVQRQVQKVQDLYREMGEQPPNQNDAEPATASDDTKQEPEPQPAPKPEPVKPVASEDQTLLQKYRTLQGMYNAEVPRLHAQLRDKDSQLAELVNRVSQLEQLVSNPQPKPTPVNTKFITEDDEKEYGDSIGVMKRAAREEAAAIYEPQIRALQEALNKLQGVSAKVDSVKENVEQAATTKFWQDLELLFPNYREVNDMPEFKNWLLGVDPLSGTPRQAFLLDAQRKRDAARVAAFFEEWVSISGSDIVPEPEVIPQPQPKVSGNPLEAHVSPGKSKTTTPSEKAKKTYTRDGIKAFYHDKILGKYKGREAEFAAIESDIFAAQKEGRIVG